MAITNSLSNMYSYFRPNTVIYPGGSRKIDTFSLSDYIGRPNTPTTLEILRNEFNLFVKTNKQYNHLETPVKIEAPEGNYSIKVKNLDKLYFSTDSLSGITVGCVDSSIESCSLTFLPRISIFEEIKEAIKTNVLIKINYRQQFKAERLSESEIKARNSLRDMITEADWRKYITNGFVIAKGKSGKFYQIFKDQRKVRVYEHGNFINEICIHTDAVCPPTDHVINIKLLVEYQEDHLWKNGNIYKAVSKTSEQVVNPNNILDMFNKYKQKKPKEVKFSCAC